MLIWLPDVGFELFNKVDLKEQNKYTFYTTKELE
jgi:hypothetical protein